MPNYDSAIPGFASLTGAASGNIKDLLSGLPSPDNARLDNAWYGAGTGLDSSSPFLNNRGRALYGRESEKRKQTGLENFLSMLKSFSGSVVPTTGQEQQNNQFNKTFGYQQQQDQLARNDMLRDENDAFREGASARWNTPPNGMYFSEPGSSHRKPLRGIFPSGAPY